MEYFELGDLKSCLSSLPPLREIEAQEIVFQILEALDFMHDNDFAHRDLKLEVICPFTSSSDYG